MVEADLVDRGDRGVGVGVGGEQHAPRVGVELDRLEQELGAAHVRHALVHEEERDLGAALEELVDGLERLGAGGRLDDPVVGSEVMPEVALDGVQHFGIVIDGQQDGLGHAVEDLGSGVATGTRHDGRAGGRSALGGGDSGDSSGEARSQPACRFKNSNVF